MSKTRTVDARRAQILAAAIAVLAREGIAETTTRKIASEAEVNQAMLRYYFDSKDGLLFAVLQEMMQQTRDVVRQVSLGARDLRSMLRESLLHFWQHFEKQPELQVMQYELTLYALRNPASAWLARQQYDGYCAVVETLLADGLAALEQKSVLPLSELARFVVSGVDGLILQYISFPDAARARRDLEHLADATAVLAAGPGQSS